MTKSALDILQQFKKQIDEANTTLAEAMQLKKHIDVLEVTIMMIPTRGASDDKSDTTPKIEAEPVKEETRGAIDTITEVSCDAGKVRAFNKLITGNKGVGQVVAAGMKSIDEYTDLIGAMYSTIQASKENNLTKEFKKNISPALVLSDMKNARDKKTNLRIFTDLDVMFCGMVFIVKAALEAIQEAVKSLKELAKIQDDSLSCCIPLPWSVQKILAMREVLQQHTSALSEQTISLQNAIGIASYNVQLQMYESLMDASSNLAQFYDMRELWKKKIGPDKTRTTALEFCEAMLMSLNASSTGFKDSRKKYLFNNFKYRFSSDNILLHRYVNELYNTQQDDFISVFELSEALTEIFAAEANRNKSAFDYTRDVLLEKESKFASSIVFEFVDVDKFYNTTKSDDEKKDDKGKREAIIANKHTWSKKHEVQPFSRLMIVAKVPNADEYMNQFDHLVLVKYSKDIVTPGPKPKDPVVGAAKAAEIKNEVADIPVEPVKKSKCYVLDITHSEIAESESAFKSIDEPAKAYFSGRSNWEVVDKSTAAESEMVLIAWSPIVYKPGAYSPRYAVTSYSCDDLYDFNQLKCDKSSTTYYKGNMEGVVANNEVPEKELLGPIVYCANTHALAFAVADSVDESDDDDDDDDDEDTNKGPAVPAKAAAFSPMYKQKYVIDEYDCSFYSTNLTVLYIFGKPITTLSAALDAFSRVLSIGNIPKQDLSALKIQQDVNALKVQHEFNKIGLFLSLDSNEDEGEKVLLLEAKQLDGHLYGFEFKKSFRNEANKSIRAKWNIKDEEITFALLKELLPHDTVLDFTIEFYSEELNKKSDEARTEIVTAPLKDSKYARLEYRLFLNEAAEISGDDFLEAARENDMEKVEEYCKQGNSMYYTDDTGLTAFDIACNAGNIHMAKKLIENGVDVDELDLQGFFVVINAIRYGHADVLALLIDEGCDVDQQIDGLNPFIEACKVNNEKMIKILLREKCDTSYVTENGEWALDCISDQELKIRVQKYIESGNQATEDSDEDGPEEGGDEDDSPEEGNNDVVPFDAHEDTHDEKSNDVQENVSDGGRDESNSNDANAAVNDKDSNNDAEEENVNKVASEEGDEDGDKKDNEEGNEEDGGNEGGNGDGDDEGNNAGENEDDNDD